MSSELPGPVGPAGSVCAGNSVSPEGAHSQLTSLSAAMALLVTLVARRVSCSTLPLWRPPSLGPLTHVFSLAPHLGLSLCLLIHVTCQHSLRHSHPVLTFARSLCPSRLAAPLRHPASSCGGLQHLVPLFPAWRSRQADAPPLPIVQEILQFHSLVFRNPTDRLTHRCGAALDIILSSLFFSACVTVHSGSNCCLLAPLCCPLLSSDHVMSFCRLDIPQALLSPYSAHSPLPRVHDWSTVVAACHHNLSTWHQSVLAHVSGPLPGFPVRASVLHSL